MPSQCVNSWCTWNGPAFGGAPRVLSAEPDGGVVLSWIDGWVPADSEAWKLDLRSLESVGELLRAYRLRAGLHP